MQRPGGDGEGDGSGASVEERLMVRVPFVRHAVGEPCPAGGVGYRPAGAVWAGQGQRGCGPGIEDTLDCQALGAAGHFDDHGIQVQCLQARPARRHRHIVAGHGDRQVAVGGRVEHHIDRDRATGDRRPRWAGQGVECAVGSHRDEHQSRGHLVTDGGADRARPVPGLSELVERRAEHGEPRPAEHVGDRVLAPTEALLTAEMTVASQHLDYCGR